MTINYKSIIKFLILVSMTYGAACTGNYDDINTPPYDATEDDMQSDDYKLRGALISMQGWVVPFQEHQFQFVDVLLGSTLGGYLAEKKGWTEKISTYNPTDDWVRPAFNEIISGIYIANTQLSSVTEDAVPLSVAKIMKVATLHQVTDIYGPIPYSKVGQGGELTAAYDSQEDIYNSMFAELNEAITQLTERRMDALNSKADLVYGGNLEKWVKLANSLKLRLAMRIVYVNPTLAQEMAVSAVGHEIGPMTENSDNAQITHSVQNLYYLLTTQWGDYRASADIVSYMNGYKDPRCEKFFTKSTFDAADGITNGYIGHRRGIVGTDAAKGEAYSNMVVVNSTPMLWMNAAEVAFLKAEGALRGWDMKGSAADLYNKGIALSFDQWGAAGADTYAANNKLTPGAYVDPKLGYSAAAQSNITIAFDNAGKFEENLERIITQKWIANYRATGVEAWAEFRRTGYPRFLPAPENKSTVIGKNAFARRLVYPQDEFNKNKANYDQAVSTLLKGPDNMATRIWWDCNPNTINQ